MCVNLVSNLTQALRGLIIADHLLRLTSTDLFDDVSVREVSHLFRGESSHFTLWGAYLSTGIRHGCLSKCLFSNLPQYNISNHTILVIIYSSSVCRAHHAV